MYAAIAGLRTHMQNLNVIGNNIANVNTYGYKSARSVFTTALYTNLSGGSDGTATLGGANPSQIGYGSNLGSVGIDMSTGNYAVTGMSTDMMLDGDGFFIMGDKTVADRFTGTGSTDQSLLNGMNITRVGNVTFGADGYLAREDDGMCVYGFLCVGYDEQTGDPIFSDQLVPIRVPMVQTLTTTAQEDDGDGNMTTVTKVSVQVMYPRTGDDGHLRDATNTDSDPYPDAIGGSNDDNTDGGDVTNNGTTEIARATLEAITIDRNTGIITAKCKDTSDLITIGCIAVGTVKNPNGVTNLGDNYYQAGEGSGGLSVSVLGGGATTLGIEGMNLSLRGEGDDTAIPDVCRIRDGGETRLLTNGLEMSKTDLAQEIAQMILTQRGYQANTRVITVTDSMLEELVNMKR